MERRAAISAAVAASAAALGLGGCGRPKNPWSYSQPPAVSLSRNMVQPVSTGTTVIAVADFTGPNAPQLNWPDVGPEMSRALRRALFEAGYEPRLAPEVEEKVSDPKVTGSKAPPSGAPRRKGSLWGAAAAKAARDNPDTGNASTGTAPVVEADVDYVITGQVTDFHHTAALPKDASRWGLIGRRHEAVVAIEWKVVDSRTHRIMATDHTYGTAEASGKKSVQELYAGLSPSAYLFWNTPLGRAARAAIANTAERVAEIVPKTGAPAPVAFAAAAPVAQSVTPAGYPGLSGGPTVVGTVAPRKLAITGPGLAEGQEYYLIMRAASGGAVAVRDPDTGKPLVVTVGPVSKGSAEGWVLGKTPDACDLRGAALSHDLPGPAADPGDAGAAAQGDT